jgi:hypothetical protein
LALSGLFASFAEAASLPSEQNGAFLYAVGQSAELSGYTEDMIEIDFVDGKISRVGDQYGIGRR